MQTLQRLARAAAMTAIALGVVGCSVSREAMLRQKSERVDSELRAEQSRVLRLPTEDGARAARLSHLNELHTTLSAANVALGTVSDYVPSRYRGTAYDVLDEVYGTIEWNIPLGPTDVARPLPRQFQGGVLKFD